MKKSYASRSTETKKERNKTTEIDYFKVFEYKGKHAYDYYDKKK